MTNFSISINGEIFDKLSVYNLSYEDIKKTTQTANGTTVVSHIATKAKISVSWQMIKNSELQKINKNIHSDCPNGMTYFDYKINGNVSGLFHVDSRSASIALFDENNNPIWEEFTLTFIEV